jgi:hypothetical protein
VRALSCPFFPRAFLASLTLGGTTGWRFAVLQLQNLLAELIDRFEFVEPKSGPKVVRGAFAFLPLLRCVNEILES